MVPFVPVPNESGCITALRAFLISILPAGVEVRQAQANRAPEPTGTEFVVITPILRRRLETNVDNYQDCCFTGSTAAAVLTISAMFFGTVAVGSTLFGPTVASGTTILAQTAGTPGGVGTYTISAAQSVISGKLACGLQTLQQATEITYQLDVHSATINNAGDMAETIATLFRDDYATTFFAAQGFTGMSPLYADDPRQVPFQNAEMQWESRYIVDAKMQANQVVTVPQTYMDQIAVTIEPPPG
jgi:hypothetical protein